METIDRKFRILAVNPCNGKIYTEKDAILFTAKDLALVPTLMNYHMECERLGCDQLHLESVRLLIQRVKEFQAAQETHIPDMNDCEVHRCIGGIGV